MLGKHSAHWSTSSAPVIILLFVVLEVKPKVIGKFSTNSLPTEFHSQPTVLLLETSAQEVQTRAGKVEGGGRSLWYLDPSTLGTWQQEGWSRGGWRDWHDSSSPLGRPVQKEP